MKTNKNRMLWRWISLTSVIISFAFNYISLSLNIGIGTISEITSIYRNYCTPAGYTFSIWGLIYTCFLTYAIYQLLPSQRQERLYDRIIIPFIFINILSIIWQLVYRYDMITLSLFVIISMLLLGAKVYNCTKIYQLHHRRSCLYTIPFSLFLAWITFATISNTSTWLIYLGYNTSMNMGTTMTAFMLLASFILGIVISIRYRDFIFPIVIAWGSIGIWYKYSFENAIVAGVALFIGVVLIVSGIFSAVWHFWLRYIFHDRPVRLYNDA